MLTPGVTPYVKAVRRIYTEAVQSKSLKAAMPRIQDVIRKMLSVVESRRKDGPIELQNLFLLMAMDGIGALAFDVNMGSLDDAGELLDLLRAVGYIGRQRFSDPLGEIYCRIFPNSTKAQHQRRTIENLNRKWKALTDEVLQRDAPTTGENPIWYGLKCLVDPETKKPIPYNRLLAEIATVVSGGTETTGQQLSWVVSSIASRPDVAEKIVEELDKHGLYGKNAREVQFEDLANLTYLTAVIKEGMRAAWMGAATFPRIVPEDMTILGYRVPQGTQITRFGHRAFEVDTDWNDQNSFNPEREFAENDLGNRCNIMFSSGPRDCVGQKLAMLEMRLAIISLLQNYELSLVGTFQDLIDDVVASTTVEVKGGMWIDMAPRETP